MPSLEYYPLATEAKLSLCYIDTSNEQTRHSMVPSFSRQQSSRSVLKEDGLSTVAKAGTKLLNRMRTRRTSVAFSHSRWESSVCVISDNELSSFEVSSCLKTPIKLSSVLYVARIPPLSKDQKHSLKIQLPTGFLFIEASSLYVIEQWFNTLKYRVSLQKIMTQLCEKSQPEVIINRIEELVRLHEETPICDERIHQVPLDVLSQYILNGQFSEKQHLILIDLIAKMLERGSPTSQICSFISQHRKEASFASRAKDSLLSAMQDMLKQVNAAKVPDRRNLIRSFLSMLLELEGESGLKDFFQGLHSAGSTCPHRQVLTNVMSLVLCGLDAAYNKAFNSEAKQQAAEHIHLLQTIVNVCLTFDDWKQQIFTHLHAVPFPDEAFQDQEFVDWIEKVVVLLAKDPSEESRLRLLPVRSNKPGWINLFAPGDSRGLCRDQGSTFLLIVTNLMSIEGRRRVVATTLQQMLDAVIIMAVRGHAVFHEALSYLLEIHAISDNVERYRVINTLKLTPAGRPFYAQITERENAREAAKTIESPQIWMPPQATDDDIANLLSQCPKTLQSAYFASTHLTSAIARELIKFPALRHVNLSATQFGDEGLRLLCDYLNLETLELRETPISDSGLEALTAMTNLSQLNLNSTAISMEMFLKLKSKLPNLEEFDVGYTDAYGCESDTSL